MVQLGNKRPQQPKAESVINFLLLPHCSEDQHYILSDISIYIIKTGSYFPLLVLFLVIFGVSIKFTSC